MMFQHWYWIRISVSGVGCALKYAPTMFFELQNGKAEIVDFNACMECGACVNNCPSNALEVSPGVG